MKKWIFFAGVAVTFISGCTTVESTQRFNGLGVGTASEKAVCQTRVEIPGVFFCGLPVFTGGLKDGGTSMFTWNLNSDNAVYLLTREAKAKGATRVINLQIITTESFFPIPFISRRTIQASGTGVHSRSAAVKRAADSYDRQP